MMMTGRVLLVGALCVLWCGLSGMALNDYCSEGGENGLRHTSNGGSDGVSLKVDCGLLSAPMGLIKAVEAADEEQELSDPGPRDRSEELSPDNTEDGGATGLGRDVVAIQAAAIPPKPEGPGTGRQEGKSTVVNTKGKEEDNKKGTAADSKKLKPDQSSSSSGGSGPPVGEEPLSENSKSSKYSGIQLKEQGKDLRSKSHSHEEVVEETSESEQEGTEEDKYKKINDKAPAVIRENPVEQKEMQTSTSPTQVNGQSGTEDNVPMQQLQQPQSGMNQNNNSQTTSVAPTTANQHNEPSAIHTETRPPSPTAKRDAANIVSDKSTEDSNQNNDLAADGAVTAEEKQNENDEESAKEKNGVGANSTANTDESDGSTAAIHSTSPLLLLFVSAAAAAVVAA
ncbi:mucin-associated surface protein (MASP) [Trypanosoma cruzi]|uniref:Mucin-associated surface protein (MASP), putative n=1 Tax=Trypanosoma cruzi (strain CL Brener) TaxID=353153 RepID=Q4D8Q1_TRYCC|nr:mucin-associated surface protein (MASP), putative [Trypanosoma cruzi]EAN88901.1 mucin-associated surface protein (MASP), putative [Trypanosoma cruzi]RNC60369.1 mucin-associated surface protein (MASP) [Trypanosoma cruzi]|eukprot:XP_810752.1 mucin-associated surface protein (MASP) [Trypanosoma cruzi strain CL Brener]